MEDKETIDYSKIELQKVHMKRHIELAVVKVDGDQVTFRIAELTHRGDEFCEDGEKFSSSNGYSIKSVDIYHYRFSEKSNTLYVFGENSSGYVQLFASTRHFAKIMEAVNEYNETNGAGYEKQWPQKGDKYYFVSDIGEVILTGCCIYPQTDKKRILFNNIFRTREEAESALERVKKALNGE